MYFPFVEEIFWWCNLFYKKNTDLLKLLDGETMARFNKLFEH